MSNYVVQSKKSIFSFSFIAEIYIQKESLSFVCLYVSFLKHESVGKLFFPSVQDKFA